MSEEYFLLPISFKHKDETKEDCTLTVKIQKASRFRSLLQFTVVCCIFLY